MMSENLRGAGKPAWLAQSMIILEKESWRVPWNFSIKSAHGYVSDVLSIVTSESWHNFWVQKNTASLPAAGILHKQFLKFKLEYLLWLRPLHTAKYRYPAAYITAIAMPNRSHFGIPLRTSLSGKPRVEILKKEASPVSSLICQCIECFKILGSFIWVLLTLLHFFYGYLKNFLYLFMNFLITIEFSIKEAKLLELTFKE